MDKNDEIYIINKDKVFKDNDPVGQEEKNEEAQIFDEEIEKISLAVKIVLKRVVFETVENGYGWQSDRQVTDILDNIHVIQA